MLSGMTPQEPRGPRPADTWRSATRAVRSGLSRSQFGETAEALFLTSGYVFADAEEAEAAFAGENDHYIYSRYTNPTVSVFEERLRALEEAESCYATASGMAAVFTALATLCGQGDRLVASRQLFGACHAVVAEILPRWGVESVLVDGTDLRQWEAALAVPTRAVFFETPSNPMLELVDIAEVSRLGHEAGATVVVDNVFGTPVHSHPLQHGADVVVYSATKHIDGQGRALGGAILGPAEFVQGPVRDFMRTVGPSLSPFNAWVLLKGLETLELRVRQMAAGAERLARELHGHPRLRRVLHPLLDDHPQRDLVRRQMSGGGTMLTVELDGGREAAFAFIDRLQLFDISNNLGDAKSLVTHPATTTHRRLGEEGRAAAGIGDGVVRISVGLEDPDDLVEDVLRALG
jgi:O-succinylhomoserine sulfhydrylase